MTRKETLINKLIEKREELNGILGSVMYPTTFDRACVASRSTIAAITKDIENTEALIEKAKAEKAKEAWFATPEGQAWKAEKEVAIEKSKAAFRASEVQAKEILTILLRKVLTEEWDIQIRSNRIEVQLMNEDGSKVFGHYFDLSLNEDIDWRAEKVTYSLGANIGTMGTFDVLANTNRVKLYTSFASMVGNHDLMVALKASMVSWGKIKNCYREEIEAHREELDNPQF